MKEIESITEIEKGIVVIDFWAPWCGPCMALKKRFEEKEPWKDYPQVKWLSTNIEELKEAYQFMCDYKYSGIPLILILKNGGIKKAITGNNILIFRTIRKALDEILDETPICKTCKTISCEKCGDPTSYPGEDCINYTGGE